MKSYAKFINLHSRRCIWKCRLQNVNFVSASMSLKKVCCLDMETDEGTQDGHSVNEGNFTVWLYKGTFTLCPCQNQSQYPLQFPCPSHHLHWIRIPVSFRLNFMSTTASPDVKVWFCIGACKIRMETDVRISFSRSGDRSKRNGR